MTETLPLRLSYFPAIPLVRWSESPDDVPVWDWTREALSPYHAITPSAGDPDPETRIAAKAKPIPPMTFPRLVRDHWRQTNYAREREGKVYQELDWLWGIAARKDVYAQKSHFRREVPQVVLRVGLLAPYHTGDSLADWWEAALSVHFWLEVLRGLKAAREYKSNFWDKYFDKWGVTRGNSLSPEEWQDFVSRYDYPLSMWDEETWTRKNTVIPKDQIGWTVSSLIGNMKAAIPPNECDPKAVRQAIAYHYFLQGFLERFALPARFQSGKGPDTGLFKEHRWELSAWERPKDLSSKVRSRAVVNVYLGALDWVFFEMYELYSATQLRQCADETCRTAFAPKHGRAKYCSKKCARRVKKRNYRKRKAAQKAS